MSQAQAIRPIDTRKIVIAALIGNLLVAVTKFIAAAWTGSSAMWSEGVHSLVDTSNQLLLLYGIYRASRPPDVQHPFGHGRELYFWSFIVSLLIFALGAGISFYEGMRHIREPVEIIDPVVNYVVLGFSFVFEAATWWVAFKEFCAVVPDGRYLQAVIRSKDPPAFIALVEDTAAILGLVIALIGTLTANYFAWPMLDGVASVGISALLSTTAVFLARESKGLLLGEPARPEIRQSICRIAENHRGIEEVGTLYTVHQGPRQIVAALNVKFAKGLDADAIHRIVDDVEAAIKGAHPEVVALFVKPDADAG